MRIVRSACPLLSPDLRKRWPPACLLVGRTIGRLFIKSNNQITGGWSSISKVRKSQFPPHIFPTPAFPDCLVQGNPIQKRIYEHLPVSHQVTGFEQNTTLKLYGHISPAAGLLSICPVHFWRCWILVTWCNDPTIDSYNRYHLSPNGIPRGNQRWYGLVYLRQIAGKPRIMPRELLSSLEVLY